MTDIVFVASLKMTSALYLMLSLHTSAILLIKNAFYLLVLNVCNRVGPNSEYGPNTEYRIIRFLKILRIPNTELFGF